MSRSLLTQHVRLVDGVVAVHYTHEDHDPGDETDESLADAFFSINRDISDKWVLPNGRYVTGDEALGALSRVIQGTARLQ